MQLRLNNLSVARGGVTVLQGLSLTLDPGQALILRGPNGSGKTTLLRTLAGLQPAAAGTCDLPPDSVAYAAHADGLKSTLTVAENLRFWADIYGGPAIDNALSALNLGQLVHRRAGELSAGQKRRLGLARLLVTGRPVWLLDEPTVSLDQASVALFAAVVRQHLTAGGLAVIATHVDFGLSEASMLDLAAYRARIIQDQAFDEAVG
ncbi:MAG: heme ABC exporter ATP-binding protein CcmA [Tabrizicola sp.]|nr:heme ABC exporter ATP-binding protein CcmA [Tabrizicola sp.]